MPQPPIRPVMARALSRSVPFICLKTFNGTTGYNGVLAIGASLVAEFDTIETFADPNQFNTTGAFPSGAAAPHAVGPYLDALVFADQAMKLRVEYAVDRACAYRQPTGDIAIAASTPENISALRITGRFVRVSLINSSGVATTIAEFGVYVRSQ